MCGRRWATAGKALCPLLVLEVGRFELTSGNMLLIIKGVLLMVMGNNCCLRTSFCLLVEKKREREKNY